MKKIDFGSKEEFIKNYMELKSSRKMGELYNCDKGTILRYAREIGYDYSKNKEIKLPLEEKDNIIKLYEETHNTQKVAEKYNCSREAVLHFFKKINYKTENHQAKLSNVTEEEFISLYDELKSSKKWQKNLIAVQQQF